MKLDCHYAKVGRWLLFRPFKRLNYNIARCLCRSHCCKLIDLHENCKRHDCFLQSGADEVVTNGEENHQTVNYLGNEADSRLSFNPITDNSFYDNYIADTELGKFLERPVLINTITVTEGVQSDTSFRPWFLFFNDTRIRKKIDNYSLLSCNLNVKFIVNASPFYYSLFLVDYQPMFTFNPTTIVNVSTYTDDVIPHSQRPHLWLYPQTCQGGEMKLPFFYKKDWLRVSELDEFNDMGNLNFRTVMPLYNANSVSAGDVTVQVYAWASDVRLCAPTVALALQSGKDEYSANGPISTPATYVAAISERLGDVPIIGKYMKATSTFARGLASAASILGFTNVPVIDPVSAMKPQPFPGLASPEISTPVEKLTLDPKNELTVDPRVVGLDGTDELDINYIASKESFLKYFDWDSTDATDHIIFSANVVPEMCATNGVFRQSTPMAHLQHMFQFWRGDIIFRFRFICSKFHRGRVRITWDPEGDIITDAVSSTVAYTKIVDITEENDIEIRIPYMQTTPWLRTLTSLQTEYYGDSTYAFNRLLNQSNGVLTMRVFTLQTSPVASAPIQVAVSVRAADNFELAGPKELPRNVSWYALQSGTDECCYEKPTMSTIATVTHDPNKYLINMGEVVRSLRTLLRRSSISSVRGLGLDATYRLVNFRSTMARFPLFRGYDSNGIDSAKGILTPASNFNYNYVFNTPYNWLAPCYVGRRGSSIWHINTNCNKYINHLRAHRFPTTSTVSDYYAISNNTTPGSFANSSLAHFFVSTQQAGQAGEVLTNQRTQTGMSVLVPNYSIYRMQSTNVGFATLGTDQDDSDLDKWRLTLVAQDITSGEDDITSAFIEYHHSVGTDFSLLFFLNIPTLRISGDPNPAT